MYLMAKWTKPDPVCISTTMSKAVLGDEDHCCTSSSLSVLLVVCHSHLLLLVVCHSHLLLVFVCHSHLLLLFVFHSRLLLLVVCLS